MKYINTANNTETSQDVLCVCACVCVLAHAHTLATAKPNSAPYHHENISWSSNLTACNYTPCLVLLKYHKTTGLHFCNSQAVK